MRLALGLGLALWVSFGLGCKAKDAERATREDCARVAEHIADLIIGHLSRNTDEWWDSVHAEPGDTGIPADVQKGSFKTWLDTDSGKTWVTQRRAFTLTGTQGNIDACAEKASRALTTCLLAAKSKDDVLACDTKHGAKASASGSPTGSAGSSSGSALGSATP